MSEKSIVIKWALIASLIYLIFGILGYLIGMESGSFLSFLIGLVIAFPILMASFEFRDRFNNSFATLGQIMKVGLKVTLVLVVVAASWSYVHPTFLNKDFIAQERLRAEIEMKEYGLTDAQIKESYEMTFEYVSPITLLIIDKVVKVLFFGIFVSLVSGLIIRNEKPMPINETEPEV